MRQNTYIVRGNEVTERQFSALRQKAVRQAWENEVDKIKKGLKGSRDWTENEKQELLTKGKVSEYDGHHMKSAKAYPDLVDNPDNIQFLKNRHSNEHLAAHNGNYQTVTNGRYDPNTGNTIPID